MAKRKNKGKPNKQGNQSPPQIPDIQSTRKCFDKALEILRNAEEGSVLYDIYKMGTEVDRGFAVHYEFLTNTSGNTLSSDHFTVYLGHNKIIDRYVLGFFLPDEFSFPVNDIVKMLSESFSQYSPICFSLDENYYFVPFTSEVVSSFENYLVSLHNCVIAITEECNCKAIKRLIAR